MPKKYFFLYILLILLFIPLNAQAHFAMLLSDRPVVENPDDNTINLTLRFWHPRENTGMNLEKPAAFAVRRGGEVQDLLPELRAGQEEGRTLLQAAFTVREPGDHIFYFTPQPYWEGAENCFIIHYSKLIVDGFDLQDGWDTAAGLPVEIIPLTRPYGLYAGSSFSGQVRQEGKPLAGCTIEIEFYDPEQQKPPRRDCLTTQVVKSDQNGYFTIGLPWGGWWGMAALSAAKSKVTYEGRTEEAELGGVLWIYVDELP
jgi:cobalt/nickel transport protein